MRSPMPRCSMLAWCSNQRPRRRSTRWVPARNQSAAINLRGPSLATGSGLLGEHERAAQAGGHLGRRDLAVAVLIEGEKHGERAAPLLARDEAVAVEIEGLEEVLRGLPGSRLALHRAVALA